VVLERLRGGCPDRHHPELDLAVLIQTAQSKSVRNPEVESTVRYE
jgi:hypothetical protein